MWVDRNLVEAARGLDAEQLRRTLPIGQGSAWKTLTHMLAAEYVWLETLLGNEQGLMPGDAPGKIPGNQEGESPIASLDDLAARWDELHRRWEGYLATLTDASLDEVVYRSRNRDGQVMRMGIRRSDALLHVCTHAQYTTAQFVNMLRQLGRDQFPEVMLVMMARQEEEAGGRS
jgi:uncharacterized damage-inducible protein DinB